jgi:hypothetical protein
VNGDAVPRRCEAGSKAARRGRGLSQISSVDGWSGLAVNFVAPVRSDPMILSAIAERLKRRSKDDFKGRHFEASLILQAVCWYLRYRSATVTSRSCSGSAAWRWTTAP